MIIVTGTEGFIASVLVEQLITRGYKDIVCVDLAGVAKNDYLVQYQYLNYINHKELFDFIEKKHQFIEFVFHLGACSDTMLRDKSVFDELNFEYTKSLWQQAVKYGLPFLYASSAATYGDGEKGYSDNHELVKSLKPLNLYGQSKQDFDMWALGQTEKPVFWAGLKFFNVYGRNEYHKNGMASVVLHAFKQIKEAGKVQLFRSHRELVKDGEQSRDFVYVEDVCDVMVFFMEKMSQNGIFNVGTGIARTFNDLVEATFKAMKQPVNIEYIDTPVSIRSHYQYYTQADVSKLVKAGYTKPFHSLEDGVADYVLNNLMHDTKLAV